MVTVLRNTSQEEGLILTILEKVEDKLPLLYALKADACHMITYTDT